MKLEKTWFKRKKLNLSNIFKFINLQIIIMRLISNHVKNFKKLFFFFSGLTRNGPNRSVKPKKGTKKGGSIWPANLSLGFFNNNKNNKKKNKRLPAKQKSSIPASKRPPTLNNNSIKVTLRNNRKCTPRIFYTILSVNYYHGSC